MRIAVGLAAFTIATCLGAAPAAAWDGPGMWYRSADADDPGGGGVLGTGGAHDHGITCGDCHVEPAPEVIDLEFLFQPPLGSAGPDLVYAPGQRYRVDVRMTGPSLQPPSCAQNVDNFAAAFEADTGAPAGMLESDSGQSAASCPSTFPSPPPAGTTGLASDCAVVFALGRPDTRVWTFYWTAPASGTVRLSYGGVDGDCDMMSMRDGVVAGSRVLRAPMAFAPATNAPSPPIDRPRSPWWLVATAFTGLVLVASPRTRRRRRGAPPRSG